MLKSLGPDKLAQDRQPPAPIRLVASQLGFKPFRSTPTPAYDRHGLRDGSRDWQASCQTPNCAPAPSGRVMRIGRLSAKPERFISRRGIGFEACWAVFGAVTGPEGI